MSLEYLAADLVNAIQRIATALEELVDYTRTIEPGGTMHETETPTPDPVPDHNRTSPRSRGGELAGSRWPHTAAGHPMLNLIPDQVLLSINGLEILGIVYLAIAVSKLRERIAIIEGKSQQRERDNGK